MFKEIDLNVTILNAIIGVVLILFVVRSRSPKRLKFTYASFNLGLILWVVSLYFFYRIDSQPELLILGRFNFVSITYTFLSIYFFSKYFPLNQKLKLTRGDLLVLISGVMIPIGFFTQFIAVNEIALPNGERETVFGAGYGIYIVHLLTLFILTVINLVKNYKKANFIQRNQISAFAIILIIATAFGITTNVVLPSLGNFALQEFGPISQTMINIVTAYLILRFRFLDTRVLVGRAIYYVILALVPYASFYVILWIDITYLGGTYTSLTYFAGIIFTIIFVIIFKAADRLLTSEVNSRFINAGYNPYEAVESLGKKLALTMDIDEATIAVNTILNRTIKSSFVGIVLLQGKPNEGELNFREFGNDFSKVTLSKTDYNNLIFIWNKANRSPIVFDDLDDLDYQAKGALNDLTNWIQPIKEKMLESNIKLLLPVSTKEEILGIIIIGEKEADTPYTKTDLKFLDSIASTAGLAIARSLFYEEIKDLNLSLQQKIELATDDLRKQNQSLEIAMNRLERLRQQEQDMLDVLGHELRTPITIVRNALAVLKMDFEPDKLIDPERLGPYIEKALESTKREMVLIETLLAATKIDANRIQLNLDKADLDDVIRDSIDGQELVAKERRIEVIYHKPENMVAEEWQIYVDRTRIQEIQDNFLNNAVKYTLKGKVEIFIEKLKVKDTDMIKVSLKDTGIGIPQEDIPKLGRKFFRARQYIKENDIGAIVRPGGTGLGLYVSFELVKIMDGEVKVESVIGEGSTFSYTIPLYNGQAPKHIDQTFGTDQELEEQLLKRRERDQSKLANQAQEDVEIEKRLGQTPAIVLEDFKKVSSANDIISQINATRKIMENKSS